MVHPFPQADFVAQAVLALKAGEARTATLDTLNLSES